MLNGFGLSGIHYKQLSPINKIKHTICSYDISAASITIFFGNKKMLVREANDKQN
jgi:hypothetical protein